jgi:hypothetical protein
MVVAGSYLTKYDVEYDDWVTFKDEVSVFVLLLC